MTEADDIQADYEEFLAEVGESIIVRRYSGSGVGRTSTDVTVTARVVGFLEGELVSQLVQGERRVIFVADDVEAGGISLPLTPADKVVVRGKELAITSPDDSTRRVGSLIAYDLKVKG